MYEMWYICIFKLKDMTLTVESNEGLGCFVDGFWINPDYELTRGHDAKYWIPPGRILHVEKQEREIL